MLRANRLSATGGINLPSKAVVLDVVGQQQLDLRVGGKTQQSEYAANSCQQRSDGDRGQCAADIGYIGMSPDWQRGCSARARRILGLQSGDKAASPCAEQIPVEPLTGAGGVGVPVGGGMDVMYLGMGTGVMSEQQRRIDGDTEPARRAAAPRQAGRSRHVVGGP